jgi:hypothetical protein
VSRKQDRRIQGKGNGRYANHRNAGVSISDVRTDYDPSRTALQTQDRERQVAARVNAARERARCRVEAELALPALIAERDDAADLLYRLENGTASWVDIDCELQCPNRTEVAIEIATGLLQQAHEAVCEAEKRAAA